MVHKISSVSTGVIKPCKDFNMVMELLEKDTQYYYETKPIIIFSEKVNTEIIEDLLIKN